jgi:uncharacterized protein YllA (UPF0747 family)
MRLESQSGKGEVQRTLAGGGRREEGDDRTDEKALQRSIDQAPAEPAELIRLLADDPGQFSGNVVTRPMIQDSVLPTVAQVVGPGEASYLAQVEAVYEAFDVFAPVRYPRPQATLVEPRAARNLAKYGLELREALDLKPDELMERILMRDMKEGDLKRVTDLRDSQLAALEELSSRIAKPGTGVEGAFRRLQQAMEKGFDTIRERLLYQRQQDERHVSQAQALLTSSLIPAGLPQERRLNPIVPFALNYGPHWVGALIERLEIDPTLGIQVLALGDLFKAGDYRM